MKYLYILILLIFFSCKTKEVSKPKRNVVFENSINVNGTIYKIDSVKNYYLVYIKNKNNLYKIISKKYENKNTKKVKIDSIYNFNLINLLYKTDSNYEIANVVNYLDIEKCVYLKDNIKICNEVQTGLYKSKNLFGLSYVR